MSDPTEPAQADAVDSPAATAPPAGLWHRMKTDPQYAPEHLALEAVQRLGPEARTWAERQRARHPTIHASVPVRSSGARMRHSRGYCCG